MASGFLNEAFFPGALVGRPARSHRAVVGRLSDGCRTTCTRAAPPGATGLPNPIQGRHGSLFAVRFRNAPSPSHSRQSDDAARECERDERDGGALIAFRNLLPRRPLSVSISRSRSPELSAHKDTHSETRFPEADQANR